MFIDNRLKIYIPRYDYKKVSAPQSSHTSYVPEYAAQISNICYRPIFTGKEISDAEFENKMHNLSAFFNYNTNSSYLKEIFQNCNKGNIDLATTLLTDRNIDKLRLDVPAILEFADSENSAFVEKLCRDTDVPPGVIPDAIPYINKTTLPFANILYNDREYLIMASVLHDFNEDKFTGIGEYVSEHILKRDDVFPTETFNSIKNIYNLSDDIDIVKEIFDDDELMSKSKTNILEVISEQNMPLLKRMYHNPIFCKNEISSNLSQFSLHPELFEGQDLYTLMDRVEYQRKLVLKNPNRYINGMYSGASMQSNLIKDFFDSRFSKIMLLSSVLDKETMDVLFRKRFMEVKSYMKDLSSLNQYEIKTFRRMVNSRNIDGKPFMPTQKIEFLNLIHAYHSNEIPLTKINNMIKSGRLDLSEIYTDLFKHILKNTGSLTDEEMGSIPPEKLLNWDMNYIHLLAWEIEKSDNAIVFKDTIRAATLDNFDYYISDRRNIYGEKNHDTEVIFSCVNLDYQKWLKPSSQNNIILYTGNAYSSKVAKISNRLETEIENLRRIDPQLKNYVDKILLPYINDDKFNIPEKYLSSPRAMEQLVTNIIEGLDKVWTRANSNYIVNTKKYLLAQEENAKYAIENNAAFGEVSYPNTKDVIRELSAKINKSMDTKLIFERLNHILSDIEELEQSTENSELNLTIKMWDRKPQKDLFQGNYSTCCIGMGKSNGISMPYYLLNTAFNMIELKDNSTGKVVGNALCYWVIDEHCVADLVIDNIEINNSFKPDEKSCLQIRDGIMQYAQNLVNEVSSNPASRVILGTRNNDVPTKDLLISKDHVCFIGGISCDRIYLDLFDGWMDKVRNLYGSDVDLFKL